MKSLLVGLVGLAGCYQAYGPGPAYAPMAPEPVSVSGPPGGEMDPNSVYQQPQNPDMPGYPDGYPQGGYPQGSESGQAPNPYAPEPEDGGSIQPANNAMGTVTDAEIDTTLQPYGEWVSDDEYGRVWRPYATTVGVNFTPYETCGSWVQTDYGLTYQACDEWSWGWLPFHYGQWDWVDSSWCWIPDYTWSPGWVDWRTGGDYVGWRPTRPHRGSIVRDHRANPGGPDTIVRDHRRGVHDSDWRFVRNNDLTKHNLSAHTVASAEGLRQTSEVARPPTLNTRPTVSAASVMKNRVSGRVATAPSGNTRGNPYAPAGGYPSNRVYQQPNRGTQGSYQPSRGYGAYQPNGTYQNRGTYTTPSRGTYRPGYQPTQPSRGTYQPNGTYQPSRGYQTYQPNRGTYQPSRGTQGTYQPSRGTYQPSRGTTQPSRGYQSSPSRGSSYSAPSRSSSSYSRPSSSSGSSRSSSSGSRSSSSSSSHSSSGSSHSSSSSSHSSGGGGHHK